IARALTAQPQAYMFDDSLSALDVTTDAKARAAPKGATRERTMIVIAQRVSTIRHAEQTVVLEAGRIGAPGTHDEPTEPCPTSRELVHSQAGADPAGVQTREGGDH